MKKFIKKLLLSEFTIKISIHIPFLRWKYYKYMTSETAGPITFANLFYQKILGINRQAYWPVHYTSKVKDINNIKIGIGTAPGLSPNCYIQAMNKISIGDYTIIAPGVGLISSNHDLYDYRKHIKNKEINIGKYCWIGMNSVVLSGVVLGDHTIVAAGSVVTNSFEQGYCVIGGVPARKIKELDKNKIVEYKNKYEFYGYYPVEKFGGRNQNE